MLIYIYVAGEMDGQTDTYMQKRIHARFHTYTHTHGNM